MVRLVCANVFGVLKGGFHFPLHDEYPRQVVLKKPTASNRCFLCQVLHLAGWSAFVISLSLQTWLQHFCIEGLPFTLHRPRDSR